MAPLPHHQNLITSVISQNNSSDVYDHHEELNFDPISSSTHDLIGKQLTGITRNNNRNTNKCEIRPSSTVSSETATESSSDSSNLSHGRHSNSSSSSHSSNTSESELSDDDSLDHTYDMSTLKRIPKPNINNACQGCDSHKCSLSDANWDMSSQVKLAFPTSFDTLVRDIRAILGPSSGIDSDDVDVNSLMETMRQYNPCENSHEWEKYALSDPSLGYTRNGVDECNDKANLLILVWNPSRGSMIHDHANAHCVMKILKGSLVESLYDWPADYAEDVEYSHHSLKVKKTTRLNTGDVAYMSDTLGLHRMTNPDSEDVAVSLHLYTPPYAAKFGCHTFEELTGKCTKVKMSSLYSDKGVILGIPSNTC